MLRLEITPATGLQYYVDGLYIGSSSELGTQFEVNAGARRIEIRAPGYKPVIFDARFVPGETITRRGALEPLEDVAMLPRAAGSKTMYRDPGLLHGQHAAGTKLAAERLRHRPADHARRPLMTRDVEG